ncbi:MAG: hypothetical protein Q8L65_02340 [Burkholderiales bacterium]|nr:hypothetical protein [Burkholderiales bacterium]MDP2397368.1 hypothetical protein [Burkholderiales bacterium]
MKTVIHVLFACALGTIAVGVTAQQSQAADNVPLGTVEAIYVRVAPGLFIETRLQRGKVPAETWSDVHVRQNSGKGKPRNELAKNPEGMAVRQGDVVQLTVAPLPEFATAPMAEVTRVTEHIAPAGSRYAREFRQQSFPTITQAEGLSR